MYKGPVGPESGRTGRSQAEAVATDKSFPNPAPYDYTHGVPVTDKMPRQAYDPVKERPATSGTATYNPTPFAITGR